MNVCRIKKRKCRKMMESWKELKEYFVSERIEMIISRLTKSNQKHLKAEEAILNSLDMPERRKFEQFAEDLAEWRLEEYQAIYCQGFADGMRTAHDIF